MSERERGPSTLDRLNIEWDRTHAAAKAEQPLVEPTPDEARNGWTAETLTEYLTERRAANSLKNDKDSLQNRMAKMPARQNNRYSPHRWRA